MPETLTIQRLIVALACIVFGLDKACAENRDPPVLVLVSSQAAAGPARDDRPLTERDAPRPICGYGRSKLEPLASVIEGTIISVSGLFIFYGAMIKIIHHQPTEYLNESIMVMIISIVITGALVLYLNYVSKKTDSMVIRADALHYKTDLFSNGAVLLALVLIAFTGENLIDPILGIGIAGYMIYSSYPLIKDGVLMLLDAALEAEEVEKIEYLIERDARITDYHDLRTRRSASEIFISVHLVFDTDTSLVDAHHVSDDIELGFAKLFPDDTVHSIVHLDPFDDSGPHHH